MNKWYLWWICLILTWSAPVLGGTVSGYVNNAETGETIIGVNILVEETEMGTTTNQEGFFAITSVPRGAARIRFSHIAFRDTVIRLEIAGTDEFLGTISLTPAPIRGEAIEVTAARGEITEPAMDIASFQVSPEVLREVPQLGKDVFQLVKYSPGVTISDPLSPLYHVRGSETGANLVQLDGMTIYNPQHMLSMQAIFNPYAIKNVEMLVGGFDAQYGGRTASILNITTREGHHREVRGEFRPSTGGIVGAVEFPVDKQSTAMISGRVLTSLTDYVLLGTPNLMMDFNGAYRRLIGNTRVRLSLFFARDYIDYDFARFGIYFDDPIFRDYSTGFKTNTTNAATGFKTRSILTPALVLETHWYYSAFRVDNRNFIHFQIEENNGGNEILLDYDTRVINEISDLTGRARLSFYTFFNQTLQLGTEGNFYRFANNTGLSGTHSDRVNHTPNLYSVYFQDKVELGPILAKAGLRFSTVDPEHAWNTEPRVSLAFRLPHQTIKFAWGRYNQYITTLNTQDYEISQYLDYYYPLRSRTPITSTHYIAGLEGNLTTRIDYSISAYYKDLSTVYRFDYSTVLGAEGFEGALEPGAGEAMGIEFLIKGEYGPLSGWIGYTLSKSIRSFPSVMNGKTYRFDGDQPHNLKALLLYQITPAITANFTLRVSSGFPGTWSVGRVMHYTYKPGENDFGGYPVEITPAKNNVRYPPRVLLDAGWKKRLRSGFGYHLAQYLGSDESYFTLSVQNILFLYRNPWMYVYFPDYGYYGMDIELVPIITAGYSIKF